FSRATVKPQIACPDVRSLTTGSVSILAVEIVAAADDVPEHCRVTGSIAPEIHFEVNLPAAWNRRFYMSGNGGFAGETSDSPPRAAVRAAALRHGFVTATTNTGHDATKEPLAGLALEPQTVTESAAPAGAPLPLDTVKLVADVVYAKCAGADGIIDDPRRCPFAPTRDLPTCAGVVAGPGCVTEAQARALKKIYGGVIRDGKPYFP